MYAVIIEYVIVFILAMLARMWSTAAGVFRDLDPLVVFLIAAAGSLIFAAVVLVVGGYGRDRIAAAYTPDADGTLAQSKMRSILDRFGVPGLVFSSAVFGPSLTLAAVLALGIDRKRFLVWFAVVTVVTYALAPFCRQKTLSTDGFHLSPRLSRLAGDYRHRRRWHSRYEDSDHPYCRLWTA